MADVIELLEKQLAVAQRRAGNAERLAADATEAAAAACEASAMAARTSRNRLLRLVSALACATLATWVACAVLDASGLVGTLGVLGFPVVAAAAGGEALARSLGVPPLPLAGLAGRVSRGGRTLLKAVLGGRLPRR